MISRMCKLLRMQKPVPTDEGLLFASGASVPSSVRGYQPGSLFQDTTNGVVYVNEGTLASCTFRAFTSAVATPGTAEASSALVLDAYKTLRWGGFNTGAALTDAVDFASVPDTWSDGQYDILSVFGGTGEDLTGLASAKCGRFRHVVNFSGTQNGEIYGLVGQVVAKTVVLGLFSAGLMGTIESNGGFHAGDGGSSNPVHAGVIGRPGGSSITVDSGAVLAAVAALSNTSSATNNGDYAGVYIGRCQDTCDAFPVGLLINSSASTTGIEIGSCTTGILLTGTQGNGISATGTFTDHVIDIQPAVSMGANKAIYIGTWGTEASYDDDGGLFRIYGKADSGGSTSAMIFTRTLTDSTSSVIGCQFYADCDAGTPGPTNVEALNCFAILNAGKYLAASTSWMNGLKGAWLKVAGDATSVCNGNVAPLWVDNQMSCSVGGEEYGIIATTGGTRPDGFIGFETSSSGYEQLFYFDETFNSGAGTCVTTDAVPGTQDARIKVYYDGTQYYIALYK